MSNSKRLRTILEGIGGAIQIAFTILLSPVLRRWYRYWGTTGEERRRIFPGDEYVPRPKSEITGAITVHALPDCIWPWFVQLGCRRAGWYSYDLLDNGGVPSTERILPEYQRLEIGDIVKAMPDGNFGFPVAEIHPERALVLAGTVNTQTGKPADSNDPDLKAYFSGDQTFVIDPIDEKSSRLLFRMRMDWNPSFASTLGLRWIVEPISFVMGRKLLRSIKGRAEALAASK